MLLIDFIKKYFDSRYQAAESFQVSTAMLNNWISAKREVLQLIDGKWILTNKKNKIIDGVGIYGAAEPELPWSRKPWEEFQADLALPPALETDIEPTGTLTVEGYTVWHSREGDPLFGILCGRTKSEKRAWAQTRHGDADLLQAMMNEEWVGKTGRFAGREDSVNFVEFG